MTSVEQFWPFLPAGWALPHKPIVGIAHRASASLPAIRPRTLVNACRRGGPVCGPIGWLGFVSTVLCARQAAYAAPALLCRLADLLFFAFPPPVSTPSQSVSAHAIQPFILVAQSPPIQASWRGSARYIVGVVAALARRADWVTSALGGINDDDSQVRHEKNTATKARDK